MPKTPNLRTWEPKDGDSKDVMDTKMLNTQAREVMETVDAKNSNTEDTNPTPDFGPLGAQGRH